MYTGVVVIIKVSIIIGIFINYEAHYPNLVLNLDYMWVCLDNMWVCSENMWVDLESMWI